MANFPTVQGMGGSLQDALKSKVKVQKTESGNVQHIRYDSYSGDWTFGKDNEDITGETVTIITNSFSHGWHRWADREVFKRMASFLDDLPDKPESVEDRKGKTQTANEARGFQCVIKDGDNNIQMSWEHSTDGCRRSIDGVLDETMARAQEEPEFLYPVVKLGNETPYENSYKDGEMIFPPKLEIIGWRNEAGEDAPDAAPKLEKPKKAKKAAKEEAPEEAEEEDEVDEDEDEAPKRSRRRRSA
tara:strand:- start:3108 stop:3839 length:732 start_codon:yes stop_codon:yes gene_type:complete